MRITKKEIAAKLGTDEAGISRALDDLLSALNEEIMRREALEQHVKVIERVATQATQDAATSREQALKLARIVKAQREQAPTRDKTTDRIRANSKVKRKM